MFCALTLIIEPTNTNMRANKVLITTSKEGAWFSGIIPL